jgi:tetratricopeptide (TPR) repeat protein
LLLPYLEPAHASPVLAAAKNGQAALKQLTRRAVELAVPLVLQLSSLRQDAHWSSSATLVEVASGKWLLSGNGSADAPEAALSEALQSLDKQYRAALGTPGLQGSLGVTRHVSAAPNAGIVIDAFRLVQRDGKALANLQLHNIGPAGASELTARIRSQRELLAELTLGQVSAGAGLEHEIALQALPQGGPPELRLEVEYKLGDERHRAESQLLGPSGSAAPSPLWQDMPAAYHELTRTATRHYDAGDWQEARRLFLSVYAAAPNARIACALGFVEFDLRHLPAARKYLEDALSSAERPINAEQHRQVEAKLRQIDTLLERPARQRQPATPPTPPSAANAPSL